MEPGKCWKWLNRVHSWEGTAEVGITGGNELRYIEGWTAEGKRQTGSGSNRELSS